MSYQKIPNRRAAKNSEGYLVERIGSPLTQFSVIYEDDKYKVVRPLENLSEGNINAIKWRDIKFEPPFEHKNISDEEKMKIAYRMEEGMAFLGDRITITE